MARRKRGMSWRAKLAVLLAVFALVPLLAATIYSLREQERMAKQQTLTALEGLVGAKAEAINQFADYRRRDAERMATLLAPFLVKLEEAKQRWQVAEEPPPERLPELRDGEEAPKVPEGEDPPDAPRPDVGTKAPAPEPAPADDGGDPPDPEEPPTEAVDAAKADADKAEEPAPPPAVQEALAALRRAVALIAWDLEEYEEILVMDPDGRVVVSTFEQHEGTSGADLRYFEKGKSGTYLEPVFLSPITGELTMVIATPIRNEDRQMIGVLAARLNLKRFFHLLGDSTGLGKTGEIVAGRVENDHVIVVAPTRHRPDAALQLKVALGGTAAKPLQEAARGQTGAGEAFDYRSVESLAAWKWVPSLEWGLVVKMDEAEALASVDQARATAWAGGFVLVVLAIAGALLVARLFVRHLAELQEATEKLSRGDFNVSLDIRSNDEIGELADSFERMVAAIKFFREHSRSADEDVDSNDTAPAPDDEPPK